MSVRRGPRPARAGATWAPLTALVWVTASLGAAAVAHAEPTSADPFAVSKDAKGSQRAAALAEAAARARAGGDYAFAIQALQEAYELSATPDLLFSIGDSYRQRFAAGRAPEDAANAVVHLRRYVERAPGGANRAAAERAIAALEPEIGEAGIDEDALATKATQAMATRLSVLSNVLEATVQVDGGEPTQLPAFLVVQPGKHTLTVRAAGYEPEVRVVRVAERSVYPAFVSLDPKPARLSVTGPTGAGLFVDGTFVSQLPLAEPTKVEPGARLVEVRDPGYETFSARLELDRGRTRSLAVDLEPTTQRTASWILIGTGGAGIAAGVGLGIASVVKHREARDLRSFNDAEDTLSIQDQRAYDAAISARDDFRVGSGIAGGVGLGLFVLGGVLFAIDSPGDSKGDAVSARPTLGPGLAATDVTFRF